MLMVANTKFFAKQINKIARERGVVDSNQAPQCCLWNQQH
jgi:hypothetical protein